jgi:hypothetical protein
VSTTREVVVRRFAAVGWRRCTSRGRTTPGQGADCNEVGLVETEEHWLDRSKGVP